jgi:hypothetical protein
VNPRCSTKYPSGFTGTAQRLCWARLSKRRRCRRCHTIRRSCSRLTVPPDPRKSCRFAAQPSSKRYTEWCRSMRRRHSGTLVRRRDGPGWSKCAPSFRVWPGLLCDRNGWESWILRPAFQAPLPLRCLGVNPQECPPDNPVVGVEGTVVFRAHVGGAAQRFGSGIGRPSLLFCGIRHILARSRTASASSMPIRCRVGGSGRQHTCASPGGYTVDSAAAP